jgi:lipopolysaccharide transport system ATP-binding protein
MSTVVRTENLSKLYRLGEINRTALYEHVERFVAKLRGRGHTTQDLNQDGSPKIKDKKGHMWALRDVNIEIKDGDVVGIIGRNGAGKSTLLKILSRITSPTSGRAEIRGRLASLLEVGTGFHGELTGRENVYLNGTILGMKKAEINRRFDEIVEFSGVKDYIDTPVKRYSSGMNVRLAFAVAAHLDPDILIVDEVLAVGDAAFQQKCLGKIGSAAREGRTILFVSHNAAAVENLCRRGIVLDKGQVVFDGTQTDALNVYAERTQAGDIPLTERSDRRGSGGIKVQNIAILGRDRKPAPLVAAGQPTVIAFDYEKMDDRNYQGISLEMMITTMYDTPIFEQTTKLAGFSLENLAPRGRILCFIESLPLTTSSYRISYRLVGNHGYLLLDQIDAAAELHVEGGDFFGTGLLPPPHKGHVLVAAKWDIESK